MRAITGFWREFRTAFESALEGMTDEEFREAWKGCAARTKRYEEHVLPEVANTMGLKFQKEDFKVDFTLCEVDSSGNAVPIVFIESENNARSADHEVRKLACLHAPLKVLVVCAEWSNDQGDWSHKGDRDDLSSMWAKQINAHNAVWPSTSVTGVIVAEWNRTMRYYSLAFGPRGEIVDPHECFFDREISE
ncbi:hypothetical protein [Thioalkalivibrio sp. ALE19]|uniref:hypothetical protein n=1 Tax=Thioalkalivibrio sp. ALE19 TaxID=1266909 RepID=UPI000490E8C8|nr:hypothetical protein [Thioalkalivibrio sp. ALE19]